MKLHCHPERSEGFPGGFLGNSCFGMTRSLPGFVALGALLKKCPHVITLGVRPQLMCYSNEERAILRSAPIVLFPTSRYVGIFQAAGKPTFPSPASYYFRKWRFPQWALASYFNLPSLLTRCYKRSTTPEAILEEFSLPLRVMDLKNDRSGGVLVENEEKLRQLLREKQCMVIIQEEPRRITAKVVLVFILYEWVGFIADLPGEVIPKSIIEQSLQIVRKANLDDIAIEWILTERGWLFAGMNFPPLIFYSPAGSIIDRRVFLCHKLTENATGLG